MKSLPLWLTAGISSLAITASSLAVITPRFSPSGDPLGGSPSQRDSSKRPKPAKPEAAKPRLESQRRAPDASSTSPKITRAQKTPAPDATHRAEVANETTATKPAAAPGISISELRSILDSISSRAL